MKKSKQLGIRITAEEYARLERVQSDIAEAARGQRPEISEILRSVIGWGNPLLVSAAERVYIAGGECAPSAVSGVDVDAICAEHAPILRKLDQILHADPQLAEWIAGNVVTFHRVLNGNLEPNVGLVSNRQSGILGGLLVSILGGLVLLYGKE